MAAVTQAPTSVAVPASAEAEEAPAEPKRGHKPKAEVAAKGKYIKTGTAPTELPKPRGGTTNRHLDKTTQRD